MRNAAADPGDPPVTAPDPATVARFRAGLRRCDAAPDEPLAVAVSGGPDSLALLLLARAALPGRVAAATVDHGLRPESAGEAAMVAGLCARLDIPHATLKDAWESDAPSGVQAAARAYRYRLLAGWCRDRGLGRLATAHHADDQAETLLMRLARGSGTAGLAGIRRARPLDPPRPGEAGSLRLVRPLLGFTKAELAAIVTACGIAPVDDPSNADPRYDRTRARRLLADTPWLDPARLAAAASHMADDETALAWAAAAETGRRMCREGDGDAWTLDPAGLPDALLRRIVDRLIRTMHDESHAPPPDGPALTRLIARLRDGESATLGRILARPGALWRFTTAPPRRTHGPGG